MKRKLGIVCDCIKGNNKIENIDWKKHKKYGELYFNACDDTYLSDMYRFVR